MLSPRLRNTLISFILLAPLLSVAKSKKRKRPPINPTKQIDIQYGNAAWNVDPSVIDEALVVIRDVNSGRIVLINLFENGPDEALFTGRFIVSWGTADAVVPEVFIPEQNRVKTQKQKSKLLEAIKNKKVRRKPFILTRGTNGQQVIEVFDTRKQAKLALLNFKEKINLKKASPVPEEVASESNLELAEAASQALKLAAIKKNVLDAESTRLRLAQLEEKSRQDRIEAQKLLAAAEIARRKKMAAKISQEAIQLYQAGKFPQAQSNFEKAVDLDPENKSYYFAFGATLYSNKKYNKAIVILKTVGDEADVNPLQRDYFLGLSYQRVQDYEQAIATLEGVKNKKQEPLSSSSAFYQGMAKMSLKRWEPAKADFQWVLDNSQDPRLDEKAEEMIERLARIQQFESMQKQKHSFTAGLGVQYDSNVLLQAENATNTTASDKSDFRFTGLAGYQYRPVYTKDREWSLKSDIVYIYSLQEANAKADPMVISLSSPYIIKGKSDSGKAYKSQFKTKLDMVFMDPTEGKTRENILDIYGLEWEHTIIQSETKFTKYSLGILNNNSHTSTDDDNSDALSYFFGYSNTYFLDKKKGVIFVNDNDLTYYDAKGVNQKYIRLNFSGTYLRPLNWKNFSQIMKASLFYSSYPDAKLSGVSEPRADINLGLNYLLSKKLSEHWSFIGGLTYTKNDSSQTERSFSKFVVMSMVNGAWKF